MVNREDSELTCERNEAELNRLYRLDGLSRELSHTGIERLEAEQDEIEWRLGNDGRSMDGPQIPKGNETV